MKHLWLFIALFIFSGAVFATVAYTQQVENQDIHNLQSSMMKKMQGQLFDGRQETTVSNPTAKFQEDMMWSMQKQAVNTIGGDVNNPETAAKDMQRKMMNGVTGQSSTPEDLALDTQNNMMRTMQNQVLYGPKKDGLYSGENTSLREMQRTMMQSIQDKMFSGNNE